MSEPKTFEFDTSKIHLAFWAWPGDLPFPSRSLSIWIPDRLTMSAMSCPGSDDPVALLRWVADTIERDGKQLFQIGPALV